MKRSLLLACALVLFANSLWAGALGTSTQTVIPAAVQQIISVDYRQVENSPIETQLHDRVLPDDLKQFEASLKGIGIVPQRDIDRLTFASFRYKGQLRFVGMVEGNFALKPIIAKLRAKKIRPGKFEDALFYPMGNSYDMTLLDNSTMLFGDVSALKAAIRARDGEAPSLTSNTDVTNIMPGVENGAVWSVLDAAGTQTMMHSALGDAARLADYDTIKQRMLGSRYSMDFTRGVNFNLDVITSDSLTASTLSALIKAGMLYKKMQATGPEKVALDSMGVNSDGDQLKLHFKTEDKEFESLLNSAMFAAVSR